VYNLFVCLFIYHYDLFNGAVRYSEYIAPNDRMISPLNPKLAYTGLIFNSLVRTAKKTQHFTITKINWLTLFKEIIAVYSENHTKHINKKLILIDC
jgi:hypothetical protein